MPTEKKLVAAAAHTAAQADLLKLGVENARLKVDRAHDAVEAAEDALEVLELQYQDAVAEADAAREAASGLPSFAQAKPASVGLEV